MNVASRWTARRNASAIHFTTDAVCVNLVAFVSATNFMNLGEIVRLINEEMFLSKYDIAQMTEGQRQILLVGMAMERKRISNLIKNEGEVWETVLISEIVEKIND
jgi:hypothetical protein